jgi:hypothetical protein
VDAGAEIVPRPRVQSQLAQSGQVRTKQEKSARDIKIFLQDGWGKIILKLLNHLATIVLRIRIQL